MFDAHYCLHAYRFWSVYLLLEYTLVSYLRDLNLTLQRIREVKQAKKGLPKSASKEPLSGLNLNFLLACPITCSVSRKDKANPGVSAM